MSITIIQSENEFRYNKKIYKYGAGLIELANQDFSELKKFIAQDFNHVSVTYNEAFNFLFKSLKDFISLNNSIHFNFMVNTLEMYYEQAQEIDDYDKPFLYTEVMLDEFMRNVYLFFSKLFVCRSHIKEIIKNIDRNSNKKSVYKIIRDLYLPSSITKDHSSQFVEFSQKQFFISTQKAFSSPFDYCEEKSHINLVFNNSNKPSYELYFSTIEEFCNFELKEILERQIPIAICPQCLTKYIKTHGNQKYCSSKCKLLYLDNHHSKFYILYRKRARYLNNKYNSPLNDLLSENYPSEQLQKLYAKYKHLDDTNEELLKEFDSKLHKIK